jgi:hypothetical protein
LYVDEKSRKLYLIGRRNERIDISCFNFSPCVMDESLSGYDENPFDDIITASKQSE